MTELITLDEYYNIIGKELFSDWSEETVYYYSERKKELKHLKKQASKTYASAINNIWNDGSVKVSIRLEQGYIDPPFVIEEFDFAHSGCISKDGDYYRCKLEIDKEARGRPRKYGKTDLDDLIREYVREHYITKGISLREIKHAPVIQHVTDYFTKTFEKQPPAPNTIGNRLKSLYPECKKTSRNFNN